MEIRSIPNDRFGTSQQRHPRKEKHSIYREDIALFPFLPSRCCYDPVGTTKTAHRELTKVFYDPVNFFSALILYTNTYRSGAAVQAHGEDDGLNWMQRSGRARGREIFAETRTWAAPGGTLHAGAMSPDIV